MRGIKQLAIVSLALWTAGCGESASGPGPAGQVQGASPRAAGKGAEAPTSATATQAAPAPRAQAREIFAEAQNAVDKGNLASASELLTELVKIDPTHREGLYLLAAVNHDRAAELEQPKKAEAYLKSAQAARKLRAAYGKDLDEFEKQLLPIALYDEAGTYAVQGKPEQALASLQEAVDAGFANPHRLRTDPELESIRKAPRFDEIVATVERALREQGEQRARLLMQETPAFSFEFKLPGLDGRPVASSDFRGKVMIVDIWGTWCPPCRKEIPHFVTLYQKYHEKGLEIIGINYEQVGDENEARRLIASFIKENAIPYPCLIGDDKTKDQITGFQGFPTSLYIDRSGKVRARVVGFNPDDAVDTQVMETLVEKLLAEEPAKNAAGS